MPLNKETETEPLVLNVIFILIIQAVCTTDELLI